MASTYETIKSRTEDAADRIAAAAPSDVADAADRLKREANVQIDRLSDSIRQKPLQSAAIAAGVGFLFAVIARR